MDISKYNSVGEFYECAKALGFSVPLSMNIGLSQLMRKKELTFQQAYNFLLEKEKIILDGKVFVYDLSANRLWE